MKVLFYIILFFATLAANSQTWAPIGAHWVYGHWAYEDVSWDYINRSGQIDVVGDTLIEGKLCSELIKTNFDGFEDGRPDKEFMYQSNDTVYFYDTTFAEFQILYCFDAVVNDTWYIKIDQGAGDIDSLKITVNSVGSTVVNSISLVQLGVTYVMINEGMEEDEHTGVIVETLGDLNSMFNYVVPPTIEYWASLGLRCYDDSNIGHYESSGTNGECYLTTKTTNNLELISYPNPVLEELRFSNFSGDIGTVKIISVDGRLVYFEDKSITESIFVSNLEAGSYFIFVESKSGSIYSGRFVKE